MTLKEAKEKYPEWYDKRIIKKKKRLTWTTNRAVYDWWKYRVKYEATFGHRYFCIMVLAIYAVKCDIELEELSDGIITADNSSNNVDSSGLID